MSAFRATLCTAITVAAILTLSGCKENKHCTYREWTMRCTTTDTAGRPGLERRPSAVRATAEPPAVAGSAAGIEVEPSSRVDVDSLGLRYPAGAGTTLPQESRHLAPAGPTG